MIQNLTFWKKFKRKMSCRNASKILLSASDETSHSTVCFWKVKSRKWSQIQLVCHFYFLTSKIGGGFGRLGFFSLSYAPVPVQRSTQTFSRLQHTCLYWCKIKPRFVNICAIPYIKIPNDWQADRTNK